MQVLFVHGLGRTPLTGAQLLRRLAQEGYSTHSLGYLAIQESFAGIVQRSQHCLQKLAERGPYAVIGHSLGGVLLRAALANATFPPPQHIYLLGSPVRMSRLAKRLMHTFYFRWFAGDCGMQLSSEARMAAVPRCETPCTAIAGTLGWTGRASPFQQEPNDCVVAVSEVLAD